MKRIIFSIIGAALIAVPAWSQTNAKRASLDDSGRLTLEDVTIEIPASARDADHLEGFPFGRPANPSFKNTRGVTLVDIDNDGLDEILFGADQTFYALNSDGTVLWEKAMDGINILPPTVDDMDGDGEWDIAVNNAGVSIYSGRTYLLNADGTDKPGWPVNFDDHWMINAPVMADVNGDGVMEIIAGERISGSAGLLHVLDITGEELEGWPIETTATVAFTPSVGDINNDGVTDVISGLSTDGSLYAFDASGNILEGFPQVPADASLSYQSPLLLDLNGDENLEIIGSRHGENAEYYAVDFEGNYVEGWPVASPGWTYAPPSAADTDADGSFEIFMGNPNTDGSEVPMPMDVIYGFGSDGSDLPNFPIAKVGGNEGVITVADIDDNGVVDLVFTSNLFTSEDGQGFVHAYAMDGSGELDGFPLRTPAMTFLNSALLGDIDGDGVLDLTTLSASTNFGASIDSVFVSAFNLELPYIPENIYFNAYKGSNGRTGLIESSVVSTENRRVEKLSVYPNPTSGNFFIELPENSTNAVMSICDIRGRQVMQENINASGNSAYPVNTSK
ncbi:MAG: FG-GAP-like repeat-containing protein, partial [Cryomorphaceae bacterium]